MTTRHSRGPRRSRPCPNTQPIAPTHAETAATARTSMYDPSLDDTAGLVPADVVPVDVVPVDAGTVVERPSHWVRVTCPTCGVVRVRADRVVVRNCVDDQTWSYRARCSECETTFIGFTPAALALPAVAAGLVVESWTLPVPSPRHSGSPLHAVDALGLHLAMLETDWFDQLARVEPLGDR